MENAQKRGPEATVDALFESGFSGDVSTIFMAPESPDRVLAPFRQAFRAQFPSQPPGSYKERTPRTFQFTLHEMKLLQYDGTEARVRVSGEAVPDPVKGSEGGAEAEYVWCPPCRFFFSVDVLLTLEDNKWFVVGMENVRVP